MKDQKTITGTETLADATADLPAITKGTTPGHINVTCFDECLAAIETNKWRPISTETYEHLDRIQWIDDADVGGIDEDRYIKEAYEVRLPNRAKVTFIEDGRINLNTYGLQSELQDELFTRWTPENIRVYTENGARLVDITRGGYTYTVIFRNGMDVGDGVALLTHERINHDDHNNGTLIATAVGNDGVTWELWQGDHDYCPHCGRRATQWWQTSNRAPVCRRCVLRIVDNRYNGPTEEDTLATSRACNPEALGKDDEYDGIDAEALTLNWTVYEGATMRTAAADFESVAGNRYRAFTAKTDWGWEWEVANEEREAVEQGRGNNCEETMEKAMQVADAAAVKMLRGDVVMELQEITSKLASGDYDESTIPDDLYCIARVMETLGS